MIVVVAEFKVRLNTTKDIMLFVSVCANFDCDINCTYGRYQIDGKSIMGMVNLVDKDIEVSFNCDDERVVDLFKDEIQLWIKE